MDVHPIKNGINRYWSIPISLDSLFRHRCFQAAGPMPRIWSDTADSAPFAEASWVETWHQITTPIRLFIDIYCIYIYGYGSIPINTIFSGMNIHESQLFWCELQGYYWFWHTAILVHSIRLLSLIFIELMIIIEYQSPSKSCFPISVSMSDRNMSENIREIFDMIHCQKRKWCCMVLFSMCFLAVNLLCNRNASEIHALACASSPHTLAKPETFFPVLCISKSGAWPKLNWETCAADTIWIHLVSHVY